MLIVKTYIGYLDSKWIYFDEENEVFQYNDQKNTSNWIMVAAPLTVFLLKGIASVLNSAFGTLSYTINISIAMIGTLIVFGMLMIAKLRKKRSENGLENGCFEGKRAQNTQSKGACNFYYEDSFCFFRDFFLGYLY